MKTEKGIHYEIFEYVKKLHALKWLDVFISGTSRINYAGQI